MQAYVDAFNATDNPAAHAHCSPLAVSVGLSSLAIGAILSTALLIGPAATALRLTRRMASALASACIIGVLATWLGVLLAYDSYYWGSSHQDLPVSFFIVGVVFATYLASGLASGLATARAARRSRGSAAAVASAAERENLAA